MRRQVRKLAGGSGLSAPIRRALSSSASSPSAASAVDSSSSNNSHGEDDGKQRHHWPSSSPSATSQALHSALLTLAQQEHLRKLAMRHEQAEDPPLQSSQAHATTPLERRASRPGGKHQASLSPEETAVVPASVVAADSRESEQTLLNRLLRRKRDAVRHEHTPRAATKQQQRGDMDGIANALRSRVKEAANLTGSKTTSLTSPDASSSSSHSVQPTGTHAAAGTQLTETTDTAAASATWYAAFKLFSEAIHGNAVTPTAQHFNLLLGFVVQDGLWPQADRVEEYYARFLYSAQELRAEKERELEELSAQADVADGEKHGGEESPTATTTTATDGEDDRAGPLAVTAAAATQQSPQIRLVERQRRLRREVAELATMESSLRPNRQTFDLLMSAALQRGAWSRVLEYFDNSRDAGIPVEDAQMRMVLQACLLGGARTLHRVDDEERGLPDGRRVGQMHTHGTFRGRTRLLTNQRGPGLDAAARPTTTTTTTPSRGIPQMMHSARGALAKADGTPLWQVGLTLFDAHRHAVTSPQTVWLMMKLLTEGGQSHGGTTRASQQQQQVPPLLRVFEDCQYLLPSDIPSGGVGSQADNEAVMHIHFTVSAAARDMGNWPLAIRLWKSAVHSWRMHTVAPSLSNAPPLASWSALVRTGMVDRRIHEEHDDAHGTADALVPTAWRAATLAQRQQQPSHSQLPWLAQRDARGRVKWYAQEMLATALHALRRVRRYRDITDLYEARKKDLAPLWTPRAVALVAQAAMAQRDLDLLLELVGVSGSADTQEGWEGDQATPASPLPPVDAYDAALHTIQARLATDAVIRGGGSQSEPDVLVLVGTAGRVYDAFLRAALREVRALERFQKSESDVQELLTTAVHLPLVHLWVRARRAGEDAVAEPAWDEEESLVIAKEALTHLGSVRRPDTVALALTMDTLRRATAALAAHEEGSASGGDAHANARGQVASRVLAVFQDLVATAESQGRPSDDDGDEGTRHRVKLALSLTSVTTLSVEFAVAALGSLGHPFASLTLLGLAATYGWLPPLRVSELQARVHHQALKAAQRAIARTEADRVAAEAAATSAAPHTTARDAKKDTASRQLLLSTHSGAVGTLVALASLYNEHSNECQRHLGEGRHQHHYHCEKMRLLGLPLVSEAIAVMRELQSSGQHRPPTSAVLGLLDHLTEALKPTKENRPSDQQQQLHVAIVIIVNAILQQISVTAASRWSLWPQCVALLQLLASPLPAPSVPDENAKTALQRPAATEETFRALASLVRYSDKAELGLVEAIALGWLVSPDAEARRRETDADCTVPQAAQSLLLDCVVWACRHREKALLRRLLMSPTVSRFLFASPAPHSPPPEASITSALVIVLQCLSSGDHKDIVPDWPLVARALKSMCDHCEQAQHESGGVARTLPLLENTAAVLGKLQLSLCYMLRSLSFDAHRHRARSSEEKTCPSSSPPEHSLSTEYVSAVEAAVDEFLHLCETRFISGVLSSANLAVLLPTPTEAWTRGAATPAQRGTQLQGTQPSVELAQTALANALAAAWEVLFAQFTWHSVFATTDRGGGRRGATARRRARGLAIAEVSLLGSSSSAVHTAASPRRSRRQHHLRLWAILQSVVLSQCLSLPAAVSTLCGDITTLEALQGARAPGRRGARRWGCSWTERRRHNVPLLRGSSQPPPRPRPGEEDSPHPQASWEAINDAPLLMQVLVAVDDMTAELLCAGSEKHVPWPLSSSTSSSSLPPRKKGTDRSPLPPLADGLTSPTVLFTTPASHLDPHLLGSGTSPWPLHVLHEAALHLFYVTLCEGSEVVLRDHPTLVRRALSWPLSPSSASLYLSVLHALEAVGLPAIRSPEAVAEVLQSMSAIAAWSPPGQPSDASVAVNARLLLQFLRTSKVFGGVGRVDEAVAAEALVCLASSPLGLRSGDDSAASPPTEAEHVAYEAVTLLRTFPSLTLTALLPRWLSGRLTERQKQHLDDWMGSILTTAASPWHTPLRRNAVVWFLGTRGSLPAPRGPDSSSPNHTATSAAADVAVKLAASGERALLAVLTLPSKDLLRCRQANLSPATRQGRCLAVFRKHYATAALAEDADDDDTAVGLSEARTSRSGGEGGLAEQRQRDKAAREALPNVLTRSSAFHLLTLCFAEELSATGSSSSSSSSRPGLPSRLPVFSEVELEALLALAESRMSETARTAVEQANMLRRSAQAVSHALEEDALAQQTTASATATPRAGCGACSPASLAQRLAAALPSPLPPDRCTPESSLTLLNVVLGGLPQQTDAAASSPPTDWLQACDWLVDSAPARPQQQGRDPAQQQSASFALQRSLDAVERFLAHITPHAGPSEHGLVSFLVLLLDANGRSAADVCLARLYPRVCVPLLRCAGGHYAKGRAPALRQWMELVRLFLSLVLRCQRNRSAEGGSDVRKLEAAVTVFGLRRVAADTAAVTLFLDSSLRGSGDGASPADVLRPLLQEAFLSVAGVFEDSLAKVSSANCPGTGCVREEEEIARAWVQSAVLLGAWKDLDFVISRRLHQWSGGKGEEWHGSVGGTGCTDVMTPLRAASVIAALARPLPSSPITTTVAEPATAAPVATPATAVVGTLRAKLEREISPVAADFARAAHRHPTYLERLLLSSALLTAVRHVQPLHRPPGNSNPLAPVLVPAEWIATVEEEPAAGHAHRSLAPLPSPEAPPDDAGLSLGDAVALLLGAAQEDFAAFVRMESLYYRPHRSARVPPGVSPADTRGSEGNDVSSERRGKQVQEAWRRLTAALAAHPTGTGVPHSDVKSIFLHAKAVPHTKHFIPVAFSESLILHGCRTAEDALDLIAFSLSTLTRGKGSATPVQQYMIYLVLKRVRLGMQGRGEGTTPTTPVPFPAFPAKGLETYTYVVPPPQKTAHGAAAAVCPVSPGKRVGVAAVVCKCYELLMSPADANACFVLPNHGEAAGPALPQFLSVELLRASTADAELALFAYECFWRQRYQRLEGVNVFLSLLKAARVHRQEHLALRAMRDLLLLLTRPLRSPSPLERSTAIALADILLSSRDTEPAGSTHEDSAVSHLALAQSITEENLHVVWRAFASACRNGAVSEPAARQVVAAFRQGNGRQAYISDVEELLVLVHYTKPRSPAVA